MALHIEFTADGATQRELDALAALVASLGGRAPGFTAVAGPTIAEMVRDGTLTIPVAVVAEALVPDAPEPPAAGEAPDPPAAGVAPPPPPANDGYTGPWPRELPGGVKIDSRGFPHDLRIHASTATTKKDGSWTYKRGAAEELIAQVEAELRAVMSAPVPDAPIVTDPAAAFPAGEAPPPPAAGEAPPPPAGEAPPPPPSDDAAAIGEFARVMRIVLAKQAGGTLTTEATTKIANDIGLPSMKDLRNRPDLIPAFEALLP